MKLLKKSVKTNHAQKAFWYTQLEWTGNKTQVLPLVEYIVGEISDHSGVWMSGEDAGLCDAAWDWPSATGAWNVYRTLRKLLDEVRRFAPYVRLRIMYCDPAKRSNKILKQFKRGTYRHHKNQRVSLTSVPASVSKSPGTKRRA